jgi:capsular exopolysaccharide synthesis family protein
VQGATNSINVRYQGTDPTLVPEILNAAAIALREYGANRTKELADQRLTYIRGQVEQAAERYRQSLGEVQRYKERQQLTDLTAEEVATINSIQDFEHQRQRRMADVASLSGVLAADTSVSIEAVNRLAAIPGLSDNSALAFQIQNVLKLYDDRRTLTAGALGLRQAALREAANATLGAMQADVTAIDRQIADLRARLQTFPGKESAFAQLTLESDLLNDTYRYLLSQYQAASISSATIHPYIEIMDAATTAGRVGVGVRQKLMIGLLVGLFLGILAAFLLEYLDQTIKTAGDVERVLDVPVLGLIPFGPHPGSARAGNGARRRSAIPLVSLASPEDPTAEAYRALRTNVTFVNAEERALQLLSVTSPGPGEGKSTTAANLAITLAQQGTHVLLVDADLRRPVVHRAFNLVQEPGLTDILVGSTTLREAARPNVVTNLDVLPAGALPPNPSELLGSAAMHRLLEQLRVEYDMVVFDSPPALAVTDSTVLGASTDGVIVVVRSGETEEAAAQQTMEQLRRVHARVAGAVLNGVAKQGDRYYYYERGGAARKAGPLAALRSRLANFL